MRIWLITVGEPLPMDAGQGRLLRTGMLADALTQRGHEVVWWTSSLDHVRKRQRVARDTVVTVRDRYRLILLRSVGYRKNISLARLIDHRGLARHFRRHGSNAARPDVILCSFPTVELSAAAVRYGALQDVPVILDVRDLWPDIFIDAAPRRWRGAARALLTPLFRQTQRAFRSATAVTAVSDAYLRWGLAYAGRAAGPRDRVFYIGYKTPTVSEAEIAAAGERLCRLGVNPERCMAWFVGIFGKTYDLTAMLEAAHLLAASGDTPIQWVLSGEGERLAACRALAHSAPNVIFTGWVDTPAIAWLMRHAALGLAAYAPGAPQGLPNKPFEYMSAGLPLISSLRGELERLIRAWDIGLHYAAGSGADLAEAVRRLTSDADLRARLGANARRLFEQAFDADVLYPRFCEYLETMAGGEPDDTPDHRRMSVP